MVDKTTADALLVQQSKVYEKNYLKANQIQYVQFYLQGKKEETVILFGVAPTTFLLSYLCLL